MFIPTVFKNSSSLDSGENKFYKTLLPEHPSSYPVGKVFKSYARRLREKKNG